MLQNKILKILLLSIAFLACLLIARFTYTQTFFFGFYIWNIFLALVPVWISSRLKFQQNKFLRIVAFICWLLFFPNAAYLVTDVLHFKERQDVPIWFDLIIVVQASWIGLLCTIISLQQVEKLLHFYFKPSIVYWLVLLLLLTTSYGVYLGRFLRFNSWDMFLNPLFLIQISIERILNPLMHLKTWSFTILFGIFLNLKYWCYKELGVKVPNK